MDVTRYGGAQHPEITIVEEGEEPPLEAVCPIPEYGIEGSGGTAQRADRCWKSLKSIEGRFWPYTALVLSSGALSLVVLFQERGFLEGRSGAFVAPNVKQTNPAVKEILETLLLLAFAVVVGCLGFLMLKSNFETTCKRIGEHRQTRYWMFAGFLALLVADILTVCNVISAQNAFKWKENRSQLANPFSHYFLISLFVLSMLSTNIMFFCVLYRRFLLEERDRKQNASRRISEVMLVKAATGAECSLELPHMGWRVANRLEGVYDWMVHGFINTSTYVVSLVDTSDQKTAKPSRSYFGCAWKSKWKTPITRRWTAVARWIQDSSLTRCLGNAWDGLTQADCCGLRTKMSIMCEQARKAQPQTASKRLLGLKGILERKDKMVAKLKSIHPSLVERCKDLWEDVKEDERYKHSAWLKSAVGTAFVLIIYFGTLITAGFNLFMSGTYLPYRRCLLENQIYVQFLLHLLGFNGDHVEGADNPPNAKQDVIRALNESNSTLIVDQAATCKTQDNETVFGYNMWLTVINAIGQLMDSEPGSSPLDITMNEFRKSTIGRVILSVDIIVRKMEHTVMIGLVVGLLCGSYSLLSVLAQYKRISLAIRAGYFESLAVDPHRQVVGGDKARFLKVGEDVFETKDWSEVVATYPMSSSMFFFGILVSTAVLQLVIFGFIITVGLSIILSIMQLFPLMKEFMALLIAFVGTWFLNDVFSQWVFGEGVLQSKYRVYRESGFVLFLLVYTMVHLVLGIFFALSRLVMLMLSSLVSLNRLDRNLYTFSKGLDQGHRSFVAAVLLHAAFDASVLQLSKANDSNRSITSSQNPPDSHRQPPNMPINPQSSLQGSLVVTGLEMEQATPQEPDSMPITLSDIPPESVFCKVPAFGYGFNSPFWDLASEPIEENDADQGPSREPGGHNESMELPTRSRFSFALSRRGSAQLQQGVLERSLTQPLLQSPRELAEIVSPRLPSQKSWTMGFKFPNE